MSVSLDAAEVTRTHFCKHPNCTNEARSDRGPFSKCDEHRTSTTTSARRSANGGGTSAAEGTLERKLGEVRALAREADRKRARAEKLTREALDAKRDADAAAERFRQAAREILSES